MALQVLQHEHIEPVFEILSASSPPMFAPFIQYIRNQWIAGDVFTVCNLSVFQMTIGIMMWKATIIELMQRLINVSIHLLIINNDMKSEPKT